MSECENTDAEVQSDVGLMLVTANVGSLFEDPTRILQIWLKEFIQKVIELQPQFLALHLQEVGGKTYEKSMEYVQEFIRCLCDAPEIQDYTYVRIYMDEDFKSAEHFTALGNIYFAHKSLTELRLWNFLTHDWEMAKDKNIYSGSIETISTKEKSKFPQHFFPECKWSRKGFMRTRWEINGTVIDLVNIHLFHDASNLAACEEFPSVYCKTRRRALVHTLERFHLDEKNGLVPFFVFGDFNFRCDTEGVVKELTENLSVHRVQSVKADSTKIHYRNSTGNNVLTVGKKEFNHADHQLKFKEDWLRKFDRELEALCDVLVEYPITFAPSYPFEEDPEMPTDYMSTRCPSWCDRILMSPQVQEVISACNEQHGSNYRMIGEAVCMGDHKPIYLNVRLKSNQGTFRCCDCNFTYMRANNSTAHLAPALTVDTYCPHNSKTFTAILSECLQMNHEKISGVCVTVTDGSQLDQAKNDEHETDKSQVVSKYPSVSINIIDTDNIYVCMCSQMPQSVTSFPTAVEGVMSGNLDGTICPKCRYIIKKQPIEHRCRLISKRLMLSENIIVNRIDAQHLSTYLEEPKEDPYTPESNESHSPCPELNSTSTTNSSNNRSPYERISPGLCQRQTLEDDVVVDNGEHIFKNVNLQAIGVGIATQAKPIARADACDKQLRGVVTPRQLKSRLEDLQRFSMQNLHHEMDADDPLRDSAPVATATAAAELCAVDHVEDACTPKTAAVARKRRLGYFPKCCNIH